MRVIQKLVKLQELVVNNPSGWQPLKGIVLIIDVAVFIFSYFLSSDCIVLVLEILVSHFRPESLNSEIESLKEIDFGLHFKINATRFVNLAEGSLDVCL
jgi:hypothetical protein